MKTVLAKSGNDSPLRKNLPLPAPASMCPDASISGDGLRLQRKSACPCGGTCPKCQRAQPPIQAKLAISQPGDALELEADRVADQVMRMPAEPAYGRARGAPSLQRRCAACDEEENDTGIHRKASPAGPTGELTASTDMLQDLGRGEPMDAATRDFFEPRFGRRFDAVRVHTDARADMAARRVGALAFAQGRDVVFRAGQYAPRTDDGRRQLAHELAHVVQQSRGGPRLQRQEDDFRVTQLQPNPERRTQGMAPRFFFEFDRADFRVGVPAEDAERQRLEAWAVAHAGQHVRLVGRASQEGALAYNRRLAQRRAETVRSVLTANGVNVDGTPTVDMSQSQDPVDYRFYRSVEVIVAGTGQMTCDKFTPAEERADVAACETAFTAAHGRALTIANAALHRLSQATDPEPNPTPNRDDVLAARFPGMARTTLLPRFQSVVKRLGEVRLPAGHQCQHRCAGDCERPAAAMEGGPVRLCPPFYLTGFGGRTISADERVNVILHETTHSAVDPRTTAGIGIDIAYGSTRLFSVLEGSEAYRNTDSYVRTFLQLARGHGGAPAVLIAVGVGPPDVMRLTTPAGVTGDRNRQARRAIGFAESWLNYASFWTPDLYDFIAASLANWSAAGIGHNGHHMLELFAPLFELKHPGTAGVLPRFQPTIVAFQAEVAGRGFVTPPVASHARVRDRTRVAGVYDRLNRMYYGAKRPLVVDRASVGDGSWSSATGLPGLGVDVRLADSFFFLSSDHQVRHVIRLMARALPDLGSRWVEAYVEAADGVHRYRGLGP